MDKRVVYLAMMGDPEAAELCTIADYALACPFCGSNGLVEQYISDEPGIHWSGYCSNLKCHCVGESGLTKAEVLYKWNKRTDLREEKQK
ncbi:hypothetical protein AGMMS49992_27130 [Clostridia bacterium]|nr:hypothetical protein AGMMS49992_27130 [Clostridia bacterium]